MLDQDRANAFVARLKALPKKPRRTREEDVPPEGARPIGISREQWEQQGRMNYSPADLRRPTNYDVEDIMEERRNRRT